MISHLSSACHRIGGGLASAYRTHRRAREHAHACRLLAEFDDRMLSDIGLSRGAIPGAIGRAHPTTDLR